MSRGFDRADDGAVVRAAVAGEQRAFNMLVERHFDAVYLTAYARLCNRESAEDLAQEVFLRAYLHLDRLSDAAKFSHWACRVARNLAEDWRRRRQTSSRLVPMVPMEEKEMADVIDAGGENARDALERREREQAVECMLQSLEPAAREIILMHYAEGLSEREIASRLGIHHTTVHYHHQRAIEKMRGGIGDWLKAGLKPALPSRRAAGRAAAIVAGAAAMSASSKSALAMASAASMPAHTVAAATSGAQAPTLLNPLAKWKAAAFAGAGTMAKGKIAILTGTLAVALIGGGGAVYSGTRPGGWIKPGIAIEPSKTTGPRVSTRNPILGKYSIERAELKDLLTDFSGWGNTIAIDTEIPKMQFDIHLSGVFTDPDNFKNDIMARIAQSAGLRFDTEKRTTEVLVLKPAPNAPAPGIKPAGADVGGVRIGYGQLRDSNASRKLLLEMLKFELKRPVVDESGLPDHFAVNLRWHPRKPEMLFTSLHDQLGLELVPEKRAIDTIIVRKAVQ